jgi:N-acetylneuraminic acid mutarotase
MKNIICNNLIFCFIFLLIRGVKSFTPTGRVGHSSVLVGDKLYFFGGGEDANVASNDAFFLDLSKSFDIAAPPWFETTPIPFESSFAAVASDRKDNPSIYLIGGLMNDVNTHQDSFKSLVHKYDVKNPAWTAPTASGTAPPRRLEMKAVTDDNGKIYVFGGGTGKILGATQRTFFNDMFILNTVNVADLSWSTTPSVNTIKGRTSYSATLLPNGNIAYIGGLELNDNNFVTQDISQIILYNTNSATWQLKVRTIKFIFLYFFYTYINYNLNVFYILLDGKIYKSS